MAVATRGPTGVLLMTYGSPASLERDGRRARTWPGSGAAGRRTTSCVDEFTRRYRVIGGSPLIPITRAQAAALER